ncbi:hypothetical protein [Polaribacter sp.]|uniref:hypothetical protein n=1 Tax=Polaribacter sp. TaxID=1920175 RepID=UPI004047294C
MMTREQHLKFCRTCVNRRLDLRVGLLCNLTGKMADFENECASFQVDESVVEKIDNTEAVVHEDVLNNLSERDLEKFKSEQELPKAIIAGIVVGIIGALLWGTITVITEYQIGYMAIAIGAAVGFTLRYVGKGIDQIFGIVGGTIALLSCLLGNFFSIIGFIANGEGLGYFETLYLFDYAQLIPIMMEIFSPMDLLFYGIAAYEGYKFSFRTFTEKELYELDKK